MVQGGIGMVAAFALALRSLGGDVSHVLAAKARGSSWKVLSEKKGRLAVSRNVMRIGIISWKAHRHMANFRMTVVLSARSETKKDFQVR